MYKNTFGVNVITLRCGNIYGGGDLNWDRLIPGVIKALLKEEKPVLRTKGEFIREWVYVKDVLSLARELAHVDNICVCNVDLSFKVSRSISQTDS